MIGGPVLSFLVLTLVLFGGAAGMTGHALARNWRPARQLVLYALLLAVGDRFLLFALFGAELLSSGGFAAAFLLLLAIAGFAYRRTQARRMAAQYPWLYERHGWLGWRER